MKKILFGFISSISFLSLATAGTVTGKWQTIDDETGKPRSIVEIYQQEGKVHGRVLQVLNPEEPNPICKKCKGEKKDKPVTGLEIMWDLTESTPGETWSGGTILDPKNGKEYACKLALKGNGEKLEVRGYILIGPFGRTQTWLRLKE